MTAAVGKPLASVEDVMAEDAGERLPIVELKPFMSKQWRPNKSMPDSYDTRSLPLSLNNGSPRKSGPGSMTSEAEAEVKKLVGSPRQNPILNKSLHLSKKTLSIHPKPQTDGISIDCEQAFATNMDREKSTVDEIKNGGSKVVISCLRRAMSELDLRKQQDIRIQGRKLEDLPAKNVTYADSWGYYKRSKHNNISVGSVSQSLPNPESLNNLYLRLEQVECAPYMDGGIYDAFDRSSTLPSISVQNAPMKVKRPRTERGLRQPSGKVPKKRAFRLGVANSLDVLRHYGKPAEVEQHLSHELKRTIKQIKKTKDLSFFDPAILPLNRYGGSIFTSRWDSTNGSDTSHQHDPESFKHRKRSQKQQMLSHGSNASSIELNLEGSGILSSGFNSTDNNSKTSSIRKSREVPKGNASTSLSRQNPSRPLIASRSSLSSSVQNAAMSARTLSMMRAETLPAIAPGGVVHGLNEMTSSRSQFLSNSAPEVRDRKADSSTGEVDLTENVPKMDECGLKSSPASPRSSVSSGTVLLANELNFLNENTDRFEPVVIECSKKNPECKNILTTETAENYQESDKADRTNSEVPDGVKDATDTIQKEQSLPNSDKCTDTMPTMTETNETKVKSGDPQDCLTPAAINIENKEDLDVNSNVLDSTEPYSNDMESGNAKS